MGPVTVGEIRLVYKMLGLFEVIFSSGVRSVAWGGGSEAAGLTPLFPA